MVVFMLILFGVLMTGIVGFGVMPHIPLFLCLILLALFVFGHGASWETIEQGLIEGVTKGLKPVFILLLVGIVIGVWMVSGTVPYLVYLGFQLVSPAWFLVTALITTMIVSTFAGSSFTTVGTVGAALMGIGIGFDIDPALCAGAIISGAMFGDKMSPLSDTTNFAPAVAGSDLFTHIRHMLWTTVPAIIVTIVIFLSIGHTNNQVLNQNTIEGMTSALTNQFNLSWVVMISPLVVVVLAYLRFPILPVLVTGIITGGLTYLLVQPHATLKTLVTVMHGGMQADTGSEAVNEIVNRGGLVAMMSSISLIIIALALGGVAYKTGLIDMMINKIVERLNRKGHFVTVTALSSVGVNLLTGEQYLSILLPGQTFKDSYTKQGIPHKTLSRTLEDAGTLVNPLVPWSVCGAFFSSTLGVSVLDYLPFVFFLWLSPIFTIILGFLPQSKQRATARESMSVR